MVWAAEKIACRSEKSWHSISYNFLSMSLEIIIVVVILNFTEFEVERKIVCALANYLHSVKFSFIKYNFNYVVSSL